MKSTIFCSVMALTLIPSLSFAEGSVSLETYVPMSAGC